MSKGADTGRLLTRDGRPGILPPPSLDRMPGEMTRLLFLVFSRCSLPTLQGIGNFLGWCLWTFRTSRRLVAIRHVERCFPDWPREEQLRVARESLKHEMKTLTELPLVWLGPNERVAALVQEVRGGELVEQALARGKGLILLTLHQGSFEGVGIPFSIDHVITGVYKPQKGAFESLSRQGRTRYKGRLVPAVGGTGRQKAVESLAREEIVYILPDQDPPRGRGEFVPFFGHPAHTATLTSKLIQESGAPALFFVGERLPHGRGFIMHVLAPDEGHDSPDLQTSLQAINRSIERCVQLCPDQYWWGYKRFRRQPEGAPDFYAGC